MSENKNIHTNVPLTQAEMSELLRLCGQVLNNAAFYGFEHRMTKLMLDNLNKSFHGLLAKRDMISFCMTDGSLLVEGEVVDARNALVASFVKRLDVLNVESFDVLQNVTLDELEKLFRTISGSADKTRPAGSNFSEALEAQKLTKVQASVSRFRRISDDQVVMQKDELRVGLAKRANGQAASTEATKGLEQIVAFLKNEEPRCSGSEGKGGASNEGKEGKNEDTPECEAKRLADLILNAAEIAPQKNALEAGESLAEIIVGCLRRQVDPLLDSPAARTKQGQKNLAKTLMLLEKCMLDRLRDQMGNDADLAAITAAIEEIKSDLQVDSMVSEFMKKRKALEIAENKLGRYMKRLGGQGSEAEDALREKLLEEGMTPEGWRHMRISVAPPADGKEGGAGGAGGLGNAELLALLLAELNKTVEAVKATGGAPDQKKQLQNVVGKIDSQVAAGADSTRQKLDELAVVTQDLSAPTETVEEQKAFQAKKNRLFEVLAELSQELFQPLSVVNATNEMLIGGFLGQVNEDQKSMLNLSADSGTRLTMLAERLRDICGTPTTATPDAEIIADFYRR